MKTILVLPILCYIAADSLWAAEPCLQELSAAPQQPLVRVVDLNVGETTQLELCNGQRVEVQLLNLRETRDPIRQAVRSAKVTVQVDGEEITLESGMYNLPRKIAGVQIDCSITKGYNSNGTPSFWGLDKDARLRISSQAITSSAFSGAGMTASPQPRDCMFELRTSSNVNVASIPGDGEKESGLFCTSPDLLAELKEGTVNRCPKTSP